MSLLSKTISFRRAKGDINLARPSENRGPGILPLILGLVLIFMTGCLMMLGWLPVYRTNKSLEAELDMKKAELKELEESVQAEDGYENEYVVYGYGYLSEQEETYADRDLVFDKIDAYLRSRGAVMKLAMTGNTLLTSIYDASMSGASDIMTVMRQDEIIKQVSATSADNSMTVTDELTGLKQRIPTVSLRIIFAGDGS